VRRLLGGALTAVGAVLLLAVGSVYARGELARDRARQAWDEAEANRAVELASASLGVGATDVPHGVPVARIVAPSISLDEVVVEGVGERELNTAPGHLPGSAFPGDKGNAVISAHRDRHFSHLDRLAIGDTVVTYGRADSVTWVVSKRQVVSKYAPALFQSTEPRLTLTTCWPVRYLGPAPERLLITAIPVAR
jgi:sortase A